MVLFEYIFFSTIFLFFFMLISNRDFFSPCVLFTLMNIIYGVVCVFLRDVYDIVLHDNTLIVLLSGQIIFGLVTLIGKSIRGSRLHDRTPYEIELQYYDINPFWVVSYIGFELLIIYVTINRVIRIAKAYGGYVGLSAAIGTYDSLTKFHTDEYRRIGIYASRIESLGGVISKAVAIVLIGVLVNNYFAKKKIDKLMVIAVVIEIFLSILTGSRSNSFVFFTAIIADIVILRRRQKGTYRKGNFKFIFRCAVFGLLFIAVFLASRPLIGRTTSATSSVWYRALFGYLGGTILNLDTALQSSIPRSNMWGQETFYYVYRDLANLFNIDRFRIALHLPFLRHNGFNTGNVYTMYYMFIEDFGFMGILPMTAIPAVAYFNIYEKLMNIYSKKNPMGVRLFTYSYMFNSLLMLLFSNRFYEDLVKLNFLYMLIVMTVVWKLIESGYASKRFRFRI